MVANDAKLYCSKNPLTITHDLAYTNVFCANGAQSQDEIKQ